MKKLSIAMAGLLSAGVLLATPSCGHREKAVTADSIPEYTDDAPELVPTPEDSLAAIFKNPEKASTLATDSTYATTASGLKFLILHEGEGKRPGPTDMVTVNYVGQLTDGEVFDSSYDHGRPATFPLNRVIPGWTEGLQLMKEGGKAVFYVPSHLGYGPTGTPGGPIPPNADLIFTVELIKVN